jgi:hypothetical protein
MMLALERLAHPRRRQCPTPTATVTPTGAIDEPPSHSLQPRTEDLGGAWPAHACRCRQGLPGELGWVTALLDPQQPATVRCGREQARRLFVWHQQLPTYEQVSFSCERLARGEQRAERR